MAAPYRILSLDGGGIRGVMTAIWLQRLQEKLGEPLHQHFDLIAGTSTGGIIACGISKGLEIDEIVRLYTERGREIFPAPASRLWNRATRLFSDGISAPKYDGEGLNKVLKSVFHTTIFGSLQIKPTLITSYDVLGREAIVLKNTNPRHRRLRVCEVCRATASAPSYFPAHVMPVGGADTPLIDGGVVANNPTACAIAEALKVNRETEAREPWDMRDFIVASFGTGEGIRRITIEESQEWGAAEWALPLIDVLFDGSADSVDYIASQLVDRDSYFRFQTRLSDAYDDLDNADQTNINALIRLANQYVDSGEGEERIDSLVTRLKDAQSN